MPAALELEGICKSFGGFRALDEASLVVENAEVHALLGENGAGKSSLMNVAAGLYSPDAGTIRVGGVDCLLSGPRDATARGIGMVHQHFKLVKDFTVAENILLANPRGRFRDATATIGREIRAKSEALGFAIDPDWRVSSLSIAEQQRVEILKVLLAGARILILDEPTAVLTEQEAERLLSTVQSIARNGAAVVLVTHKLRDVKAYAHRVTVMRGGRTVTTVDPSLASTEELTRLTVGANIVLPLKAATPPGEPRLLVTDLADAAEGRPALLGVTFTVRAGEVYGIAGVGGNGQTELMEALVGARALHRGSVKVSADGPNATHDLTTATPRQRLALGFAFIPADRQSYAIASSLSLAENYGVAHVHKGQFGSWAWVDRRAIDREAKLAFQDAEIQGVRSLDQRAGLLSGGNAQKLVLAREFSRSPTIIVAHSPGRGLDARANAAVQRRLSEARNNGMAVVLISEDLDEVFGVADRVGVMNRGRIVAEFDAPFDRQAVGQAMVTHG